MTRGREVAQEQEDHQDHQAAASAASVNLHVVRPTRGWTRSGRRGRRASTEAGSCWRKLGSSALDARRPPATVLVPGWRWMASTMRARCRCTRPRPCRSATLSIDAGRGPAGAPARRCGRRRSAAGNASASVSWPVAWTVNACCRPVRGAGGQVHVAALRRRCATSSMPMPRRGQRVGVDLHAHGVLLRAEDLHLRHAVDHRDALGHAASRRTRSAATAAASARSSARYRIG